MQWKVGEKFQDCLNGGECLEEEKQSNNWSFANAKREVVNRRIEVCNMILHYAD